MAVSKHKCNISFFLDNVQLVKCEINKRIYVGEFASIRNKLELGGKKFSKFIINPKVPAALNYEERVFFILQLK